MKRKSLFILLLLFILLFDEAYSQDILVRKIDLYIIPLRTAFRSSVEPNQVRRNARLKMSIKTAHGKIEKIDFLDLVKDLNDSSSVKIIEDYRIVCVVRKIIGREVLYFNHWGDFLYKGKTYKDERIKKFVFKHLPEYCK